MEKKKKKISLLCEEDNYWLINSSPTFPNYYSTTTTTIMGSSSFYNTTSKEDSKNSFMVFLQKELHLMPININHLHSPFFQASRVRAILWFLKSQRRLNLSIDTVFRASSYFHRFVSINNYNMKWEAAFMELLAVVCLYVAAKFGEVSIPTLHELQMEDLNNSFEVSRIQEMEQVADPNYTLVARGSSYLPSSPVTVMAMEVTDTYNSHVGLLIKVSDPISNTKKRKREDNQD